MLVASAADFVIDAGALVGSGAALGATAGFLGWLLRTPIRWLLTRRREGDPDETELDSLGTFVTVGAGIGGLCGFVLWIYDQQGII